MKRLIIVLICMFIWMMLKPNDKTVDLKNDNLIEWLRDSQSGERNALVQVGSFFVSERSTVYGADCVGCTLDDGVGSTSSQIEITTESVRQSDGKWKEGVTYDGYYLAAADAALPLCTVLRISGHTYHGEGIEKGVPFYALVVDRGSMIRKNCIDLFAGNESNPLIIHESLNGAVVEIVGFLNYIKNKEGRMQCAGE